jgi:predicted ester cyclase
VPHATDDPRVGANKATVTRMLERLSAGDVAGFTEHLSSNYVRHSQAMPEALQEIRGKEMMHQWLLSNFVPFPDYHEELEWLVGEGDFVAWRSRGKGTQMAAFGPFPSSGKEMDLVIIGMHRFEGPLVAETWTSWDNLAALTQLGHFPTVGS